MNTQELKAAIAVKVIEIKKLKKLLTEDHSKIGYNKASSAMSNLHDHKQEVRAMYLIYGWFREKRYDEIEQSKEIPWTVFYYAKKLLGDHYPLFSEWLKLTKA